MVPATPTGNNILYTTAVDITLVAADAESGVAATYYTLDGVQHTYTSTFSINLDGTHTVTYWSVDNAGNVEDATAKTNSITLQVNTTPPSITASATIP